VLVFLLALSAPNTDITLIIEGFLNRLILCIEGFVQSLQSVDLKYPQESMTLVFLNQLAVFVTA